MNPFITPVDQTRIPINTLNESVSNQLNDNPKFANDYESFNILRLSVPHLERTTFILLYDIIMLRAQRQYTHIYLKSQNAPLLASKHLKYFSDQINVEVFFKTHRSYIVNLLEVIEHKRGLHPRLLLTNNLSAPLSRSKKVIFIDRMKGVLKLKQWRR